MIKCIINVSKWGEDRGGEGGRSQLGVNAVGWLMRGNTT